MGDEEDLEDKVEFEDESDSPIDPDSSIDFAQAVLYSSDWTVETILGQLGKSNIQLNPNFQRREAWTIARKSRFIESVILGLPIPQLILAEVKGQRGRYIVLDGKQRLLSLLRFSESEKDRTLGFALSGLEIRTDLRRKKYFHLNNDPDLSGDRDAFLNYTIRTMVIRNWPNNDFLHQVFLRLNTGSVKLSAQELRQAMVPGEFTTFADDYSANSKPIQLLLGRDTPDPRMRDVELLVRHVAFKRHLPKYRGRFKRFLDEVCEQENREWNVSETQIRQTATDFDNGIVGLIDIFGSDVARKPGSRSFNRAIFDALAFYGSTPNVLVNMQQRAAAVKAAYDTTINRRDFLESVESDTAALPNTVNRIRIWGEALAEAIQMPLVKPILTDTGQIVVE